MSHSEDKLIDLHNNVPIKNWINIAYCNDLRFAKRTKFAAFRPANRQVDAAWTLFNRSGRSRVNVFFQRQRHKAKAIFPLVFSFLNAT